MTHEKCAQNVKLCQHAVISHFSFLISHLFVVPLHPQTKGMQPHNGALAQLVEHRTENPCVPGSIPGGTTSSFHCPGFP